MAGPKGWDARLAFPVVCSGAAESAGLASQGGNGAGGGPHPSMQGDKMRPSAAYKGLLAGAVGVAAMTLAEKLEQRITRRPNSFVPGHTLEKLLRQPEKPDDQRLGMNWWMHWGQGIALGAVRGWMAEAGVRGPMSSLLHMNLRLLNDQTFENVTGAGALPWTWPVDEQWIDLMGKGVYAFVTGMVADSIIEGPAGKPEPERPWAER